MELNATVREKADAKKYETERLADAEQYRVEREAAAERKRREEVGWLMDLFIRTSYNFV